LKRATTPIRAYPNAVAATDFIHWPSPEDRAFFN